MSITTSGKLRTDSDKEFISRRLYVKVREKGTERERGHAKLRCAIQDRCVRIELYRSLSGPPCTWSRYNNATGGWNRGAMGSDANGGGDYGRR